MTTGSMTHHRRRSGFPRSLANCVSEWPHRIPAAITGSSYGTGFTVVESISVRKTTISPSKISVIRAVRAVWFVARPVPGGSVSVPFVVGSRQWSVVRSHFGRNLGHKLFYVTDNDRYLPTTASNQ